MTTAKQLKAAIIHVAQDPLILDTVDDNWRATLFLAGLIGAMRVSGDADIVAALRGMQNRTRDSASADQGDTPGATTVLPTRAA